MKIAITFILGWLIAAGLVFVLGAERATPASAATVVPPVATPLPAMTNRDAILIPVSGVTASQLHDTFKEARSGGRVHDAIDILAPRGTPVIAAVDGTIRKLFTSRAGGLTIYEFDDAQTKVYYYAHLDRYAGLAEGARVRRGDVIGYVGTTGNAPPGTPHLHFAIAELPATKEWWRGHAINPYAVLTTPVSELR